MLLTEQRVRAAARNVTFRLQKSATAVLNEFARTEDEKFDIFLSHSTKDAELVLGAKAILELVPAFHRS